MDTIFNTNINAISKAYPIVAKQLKSYREKHPSDNSIFIQESVKGEKIVAIIKDERGWYFNSNYDARMIAKKWASTYKNDHFQTNYMINGLANGMYLEELLKVVPKTSKILVYEPNIEMLFSVLENIDLSNCLSNKRVVISAEEIINGTAIEFAQLYINYANFKYTRIINLPNYKYVYPFAMLKLNNVLKNRVSGMVLSRNTEKKLSSEFATNIWYTLKHISTSYSLIQLKEAFSSYDIDNIPAIIIAAGPSLDKNVDELKKAKGKALIVAVDTAIKRIIDAGVLPDIALTMDSHKPLSLFSYEASRKMNMLVCKYSNKRIMEKHMGKKFYIGDENDILQEIAYRIKGEIYPTIETGGSVACNAFSMAQYIGFKKVILIGLDLAYTEGKGYASNTHVKALTDTVVEKNSELVVDDLYGNKVTTSYIMNEYKIWFENQIEKNQQLEVIDATEGGAKIKGSKIMTLSDAITKYCNNRTLDAEKIIDAIKPYYNDNEKVEVENMINDIPNQLKGAIRKLENGLRQYYQLRELNQKGQLKSNNIQKLLKDIANTNNYVDNSTVLSLAAIYNRDDEYDVMDNIYETKENAKEDINSICDAGERMYKSYIDACRKAIKDFNESFFS